MLPFRMRHERRLRAVLIWATLTLLAILYRRRHMSAGDDNAQEGNNENSQDHLHTFPSRKIWQVTGDNKVQPARDCAKPWITSNPGWAHTLHTDTTATAFAARHWGGGGDDNNHLARALGELRSIGIRADLIRYMLLGSEGGVYTDMDTVPLKAIDEWLPWDDYLDRGARLVVGVEWDELATAASASETKTEPETETETEAEAGEQYEKGIRPKGVLHEVQFSQWTIAAAAPGHPVFAAMIEGALARLAVHQALWGAETLSGVVFSEQEVLGITGPAAWTEVVLAHMRRVDPDGLRGGDPKEKMAPPSTPAPSRFILPRKSQPPQTQKQAPVALQNGPRQFASTPRFNVSATPRQGSHQPPPFSTPAPLSTRPRATPYEPFSDAIDTSPISAETPSHEDEGLDQGSLHESIEIDSPSASRSTFGQDEPPPKRRRVSISPDVDINSEPDVTDEFLEGTEQVEISGTPMSDERLLDDDQLSTISQEPKMDPEPQSPQSPEQQQQQTLRHPTFRNAPRFKAPEAATGAQQHPLPDAFSPQRRGAKYVPGGLAAEVRDWLVQVKGASEYDRPAGSSIGVNVDEVRSGVGMHIITSQRLDGEAVDDGIPAKAILAGDGRTAGLGGKSIVKRGGVVSMSQPMWDITLDDLGHFAVAPRRFRHNDRDDFRRDGQVQCRGRMSGGQRDNDTRVSEKCARLEGLLRQTLALAGEIAEDRGLERAGAVGQLSGEYIISRNNATMNHEDVEEERKGSRCPSAASSVQEPFSPGTPALSLDAMVEGDSSDGESCFLDSGPAPTPPGSRLPDTATKKSSLSSIEEVIEHAPNHPIANGNTHTDASVTTDCYRVVHCPRSLGIDAELSSTR
ncbi:hypothetical protein VMCG_07649 [Cytospora schulzeri]|uniref:Uncharacterized protein n=1 Tax=Cytospora schulzeri TaxID=448051 RepID=A0A423VYX9_9PEZI|nr:hypothetical protein VMCG_07649 [Valsa malicola]